MSALGSTGSTYRWRQLRRVVLERDGWACQLRGDRCTGYATTVDHLVPRAHGGTDDLDNLAAACSPCNTSKGARPTLRPSFQGRTDTPASVSPSLPGMGSPMTRTTHVEVVK